MQFDALTFTQDAMRLLLAPDGAASAKDADNRIGRLLRVPAGRVARWRRGERKPNGDEVLALVYLLKDTQAKRGERLDEMERKVGALLPEIHGPEIGPLVDVARRDGDQAR